MNIFQLALMNNSIRQMTYCRLCKFVRTWKPGPCVTFPDMLAGILRREYILSKKKATVQNKIPNLHKRHISYTHYIVDPSYYCSVQNCLKINFQHVMKDFLSPYLLRDGGAQLQKGRRHILQISWI